MKLSSAFHSERVVLEQEDSHIGARSTQSLQGSVDEVDYSPSIRYQSRIEPARVRMSDLNLTVIDSCFGLPIV